MCKFFSCVSDGAGNIKHFTPAQIADLMASGNPKEYAPNSHTSILAFHGIKGVEEDAYNKWEYEVDTKTLVKDQLNTTDDSAQVKIAIEAFLAGKDLAFLKNLYGKNTGHQNTGHQNTGHQNTGDRNTGDQNTGHRNTGHRNTGGWNTGDRNTGDQNTGHQNTGHQNTGDQNTGDRNTGDQNTGHQNTGGWNTGHQNTGHQNTGHQNTGHQNTGDQNTGHRNTGHRNTGGWNTGHRNTGHFNTNAPTVRMFNKDTGKTFEEIECLIPGRLYELEAPTEWVCFSAMTDREKINRPKAYLNDGYLKVKDYKANWAALWAKASATEKKAIQSLPNFDAAIFLEITGVKV